MAVDETHMAAPDKGAKALFWWIFLAGAILFFLGGLLWILQRRKARA